MNNMPLLKLRIVRIALFGYLSVVTIDTSTSTIALDDWTIRLVLLGLLISAALGEFVDSNKERESRIAQDSLNSADGSHCLLLQADGRLVVYEADSIDPLCARQIRCKRRGGRQSCRKAGRSGRMRKPALKRSRLIVFPES